MKRNLKEGEYDAFFDGFTTESKIRIKSWFENETEETMKNQFIENFLKEDPVFILNADPLFVVYTKEPDYYGTRTIYFARIGDSIKRTNASRIWYTGHQIFDQMFQEEVFQENPFERYRIHP